ncbi:TolC family protein [Nibribacter ruber]|uniref:TolC family protein n=1 Tax=Nibribacter ruber TaxID=2698458 RepID=A0A6P1P0C4_9BACT|nr:TolC family protein [Nibribacter ruber]QHL86392.1 TolC family protein [Nibribacter ruber]
MRNFSSTVLATLGLVIGSYSYGQAQTATGSETVWTLQQAVDQGVKSNLQVLQRGLSVEEATVNLKQSRNDLLPSLNASASYGYSFGLFNDPVTYESLNAQNQSSNYSVSGSIPLYSGNRLQNSIKQSRLNQQASVLDVEKVKNDVTLDVVQAYMQILLNQELLKTNQERLNLTKLQVERTEKLFKAGSVPESNLLDLNAQMASDELNIITAQNQIELAELNLIQLLNLKEANTATFAIETPSLPDPDQSVIAFNSQQVFEAALERMPEIKSSLLRIQSAQKQLDITRGNYLPTLSLSGNISSRYSKTNLFPDQDPYSQQIRDNFGQFIGLNLNIPIFNSFRVRNNVQLSKVYLNNARINSEIAQNQLNYTIAQAYTDAIGAQKRFVAAKKQLVAFEQAFKNAEIRLNNGLINNVDFNVARNNLVKAQSDIIQAKYDYTFKLKILEFYQGKTITL